MNPGFLQAAGPPFLAAGAAVRERRPEGKLNPAIVGHQQQQKFAAGFNHPRGFGQRLLNPIAVQMIDRIGADDGVEARGFEGKFPHVGGFDRGSLVHAGRLQVLQQAFLRARPVAEVRIEGISEQIERDQPRLRTRRENHDGRAACSSAQVEHPACAGT